MSTRPIRLLRGRIDNRTLLFGSAIHFSYKTVMGVAGGRVRMYWKEVLRQAYLLSITTGSLVLIAGLVLGFGLIVGVEGSYGARLVGAPSVAGAFTSIGNLREIVPYAFGYMMAAKVSTGFAAELGTMRISDEIDALETMGIDSLIYLGSTRLLASWLILPFVYAIAIAVAFIGSFFVVVYQIHEVSAGGYFELFWKYQNAADYLYSGAKGMIMATFVVLVGCYFGYTARGGPVDVGRATAKAMVVNLIGVHFIGVITTQLFWGGRPNLPIGG